MRFCTTLVDLIPGLWKKLGINLGIPLSRLDQMTKVKYPHEMALEMFQSWWGNSPPHARWGELHHALVSVHRHDLLSDTQKFFKANNMDYNNPEQVKMDRLFFTLAEAFQLVGRISVFTWGLMDQNWQKSVYNQFKTHHNTLS